MIRVCGDLIASPGKRRYLVLPHNTRYAVFPTAITLGSKLCGYPRRTIDSATPFPDLLNLRQKTPGFLVPPA